MLSIWRPFSYFPSFSDPDIHPFDAVWPVSSSTIPEFVSFVFLL
jgi:hypothetical protein